MATHNIKSPMDEETIKKLKAGDQVFITGKCRQGLIGGVAVGGRPGRQELPHTDVHIRQAFDK